MGQYRRRRRSWLGPDSLFEGAWTLARWRWREQWGLLLVVGLGLVCAVMLAAALPLFSSVMTTAGVRSVLHATPNGTQIVADANMEALSASDVQRAMQLSNQVVQKQIGGDLSGNPESTVITSNWYMNHAGFVMNFYGVPM